MQHKDKICGICGKVESSAWTRHWNRNHVDYIISGRKPKELEDGKEPDEPWCENWKEIVDVKKNGLKLPTPVKPKYTRGFQ